MKLKDFAREMVKEALGMPMSSGLGRRALSAGRGLGNVATYMAGQGTRTLGRGMSNRGFGGLSLRI